MSHGHSHQRAAVARPCYTDDDDGDCNDYIETVPLGRFLQLSSRLNLTWAYVGLDPTIQSLQFKSRGIWVELENSSFYSLALSSFIREGDDDFDMFEQYNNYEDLGSVVGDCVARYLENKTSKSNPLDCSLLINDRITQSTFAVPTPSPTSCSANSSRSCQDSCPAGYFLNSTTSLCQACGYGQYSSQNNSKSCTFW